MQLWTTVQSFKAVDMNFGVSISLTCCPLKNFIGTFQYHIQSNRKDQNILGETDISLCCGFKGYASCPDAPPGPDGYPGIPEFPGAAFGGYPGIAAGLFIEVPGAGFGG